MNSFVHDFFSNPAVMTAIMMAVAMATYACWLLVGIGDQSVKEKIADGLFFLLVTTPGITVGICLRHFFAPTPSVLVVYHLLLFWGCGKIIGKPWSPRCDALLSLIVSTMAAGYFFCDMASSFGFSSTAAVYFVLCALGAIALVGLVERIFHDDEWSSRAAVIVSAMVFISATVTHHLIREPTATLSALPSLVPPA